MMSVHVYAENPTLSQRREIAGNCASTYNGAACGAYSKHWGFNCSASLPLCGRIHLFISNKAAGHGDKSCSSSSSLCPGDKRPHICHLCAAIDCPTCSRSQSSPPCEHVRITSFIIIDFVTSFMSLFQGFSHGCSSCSVSVRINLLTSISQAVALTGRLN